MTTELLAHPQGGIGSDFSSARSRLYLVEYAGRIARVDLVRGLLGTVSSGSATLRGTWHFDFELGGEAETGDVWWQQMTDTARQLVPDSGVALAWLGPVAFSSVSHADLQALTYSSAPIDGSIASNRLTPGTVFAVRTRSGHHAKVRVVSHGYNLQLEWRTYRLAERYAVIGTGYSEPEDIALTSSGTHAYVTERIGNLLRVDLSNANRSAATVVSTGMTAPHQLVLDEARNVAYVVEFAPSGRLLRIDLGSGAQTVLSSALDHAIGLVMSEDGKHAWVTEQAAGGGRLVHVDIAAARRETVLGGLVAPFFLEWTDASRSSVYLVERDPNNRVLSVSLHGGPAVAREVVGGLPVRPSSMVAIGSRTLVCCDTQVVLRELAPTFSSSDPLFLGIGHVPASAISASGHATTAPGYFFRVDEAPFGGTLALQINHDRAFAEGARFYKIRVDGVDHRKSFIDYEWVGILNRFMPRETSPDDAGYFPVRTAASLWYNHWLGALLDTTPLSNGLHTLEVQFFTSAGAAGLAATQSIKVRIDNTVPLVSIDAIEHRLADGTWKAVGRCGIVDQPDNAFRLRITAHDPESHLLSWAVSVAWGDNESAAIDELAYVAGTTTWAGPVGEIVPRATGVWAATEKRCAHTFTLVAWDRTIDGWGRIHRQSYSKSITLMLP